MDNRPIEGETDYDEALADIEQYFDKVPVPDSPEADHFDALSSRIEEYEATMWPIKPLEPE